MVGGGKHLEQAVEALTNLWGLKCGREIGEERGK